MKRAKLDSFTTPSRLRSLHFLMGLVFLYFLLVITQFPVLFRFLENHHHPIRLLNESPQQKDRIPTSPSKLLSNLRFRQRNSTNNSIYRAATLAWAKGGSLWAQLMNPGPDDDALSPSFPACSDVVSASRSKLKSGLVGLPCGLAIGSHVTIVGRPRKARLENVTFEGIGRRVEMMVSQFMVELRREKGGMEMERLLHFNPRIKGDWSEKPVIEMNNCYRGQWGLAVRCEGWRSPPHQDTVDGQVKCEEWVRDVAIGSEQSKADKWLKLMGLRKKVEMEWHYPFSEDKFFVLTITAGFEGYHMSVDGRHIASFAYRTGLDLEDARLVYINGDVDLHSVIAASLPTLHPGVAPERHLEMSPKWKAQPLPYETATLFIGVISAGDHFAERMAVRKSWMQHDLVRSSAVVARFFVALHEKAGINKELKKEAEFFGDIVIVPYLDHYDLVVLKTLAICEYGVNMLSAKYIMKCDDDTFVRVDAVVDELGSVDREKSVYAGRINYYHEPMRSGKWAVTYKEWPGRVYPPYADGAAYIISSDIARSIVTKFEKSKLRLFKMEDVSMGLWVEQFNSTKPVEYLHSENFHQSGCVDDYYTAHYQSPKQLICLWETLQREGKAKCCNL